MLQKHIFISGRVQGVGFRHFTYQRARELDITGWVRNRRDRRVEAVILGTPENIEEMLTHLKKGPASAYVETIEENDEEPDPSEYAAFEIKHTV